MTFADYKNLYDPSLATGTKLGQALDVLFNGIVLWCGTAGGTATALTASYSTTNGLAYATGLVVALRAAADSTATATLNLSSLGAKTIYIHDGTVTLLPGDMQNGHTYVLVYDAALNAAAGGWILVNPSTMDWTTWSPSYSCGGSMTYTSTSTTYAQYIRLGKIIFFRIKASGTIGGTPNSDLRFSLPATAATTDACICVSAQTVSTYLSASGALVDTTTARQWTHTAYSAGTNLIAAQGFYTIA